MGLSNKSLVVLAATLVFGLANAAGLTIEDGGASGGCTGSVCCIPTCNVAVHQVGTCNEGGTVQWSGSCEENAANPQGVQDIPDYDNCPGYEMEWGYAHDGTTPMITIREKSSGAYDPFGITNCRPATQTSQCAPEGGGCDSTLIFGRKNRRALRL